MTNGNTGIFKLRQDDTGRQSLNTIFGEKLIAIPHSDIEEQFHYNVNTQTLMTTASGGGAASTENDMLKLSSSTGTTGDIKINTKHSIRYRPGKEAFCTFTVMWDNGGVAGSKQRIGVWDGTDGFYLGYNGTDFVVGYSQESTDYEIKRNNFNGNGPAVDKLDTSKLNVFRISYGWLGTAPCTFEFLAADHTWHTLHIFEFQNTLTRPSVSNPSLPLCMHVVKASGATDIIMRSGSWNGGVNGESEDAGDRYVSLGATKTVTTEAVIMSFQNVGTFQSKSNRVFVEGIFLSLSTDGTKPVEIKGYKNLTVTDPTWVDVDATNSVIQKDILGTITPAAANLTFLVDMAKDDSTLIDLRAQGFELFPGDVVTLTATSAGSNVVTAALRLVQHF